MINNRSWGSYTKSYNVGHRAVRDIFEDEVIVEEKVDGSQISFGVFNDKIRIRSKRREFDIEAADNLFQAAAATVKALAPSLVPGWTYRGEYLRKPKHNVLAYDRIPVQHIVIFDIEIGDQDYLDYDDKLQHCMNLGLECVPLLYRGKVNGPEDLISLLQTQSCLGGQLIEGFVIKNYQRYCRDGKCMMAKYVSEAFREVHSKTWKAEKKNKQDVVTELVNAYGTDTRYRKAVQHLRDDGKLQESPADIGPLIKEVCQDVQAECIEELKDKLWEYYRKPFLRQLTRSLPGWYKEQLLRDGFEEHAYEQRKSRADTMDLTRPGGLDAAESQQA